MRGTDADKLGARPNDGVVVAFDGIVAAKARGVDVVLIDTAGRLHTKSNLMDELRKVTRVIGQELPGAPHETLLVLDATLGQNALAQARQFKESVGVTGLVLTKLDGTAKGGAAVAIAAELGLPVTLGAQAAAQRAGWEANLRVTNAPARWILLGALLVLGATLYVLVVHFVFAFLEF